MPRKTGTSVKFTPELIARFWSHVDKQGENECWNWKSSLRNGYGAFWTGFNTIGAHRFAKMLANPNLAPSDLVLHRCQNRACVNPSHTYVGDICDNNSDTSARFYDEEIWLIKQLNSYQVKQNLIAKMFKCSMGTICTLLKYGPWVKMASKGSYFNPRVFRKEDN